MVSGRDEQRMVCIGGLWHSYDRSETTGRTLRLERERVRLAAVGYQESVVQVEVIVPAYRDTERAKAVLSETTRRDEDLLGRESVREGAREREPDRVEVVAADRRAGDLSHG